MSAEMAPTPNQILTAACILAEKGYKLIRVSRRSKVPFDKDWVNLATNDLATLTEWFDGGDFNLGLACGLQPNGLNIVAIDIDPKHGGLDTWAAFVREHGKVGGPRHDTPSGGFHLPLIFPEGFRNSRNMLGPGIDTRGEGGQILLPPSQLINAETGEIVAYGASPGRSMWDMAPIEAPLALVDALSVRPVQVQRSMDRHPSMVETPFDFLRRTVDPVDVMVNRYGWQVHSVRGNDTYLTRPNKNPRDGHSAIVHGNGAIVVFTTTDVQHLVQRPTNDGTGIKMSLAELIAAEETGGDLGELARRVKAVMPPPPPRVSAERSEPAEEGSTGPHGSDDLDDSWYTFMDLTPHMDGTFVQVTPTILRRTDGIGLFYPGVLNGIHGESGLGKGWVALSAVADVVREGGVAVYVDLEDTPTSIAARLRHLGLTQEQITAQVKYARPTDPTSPETIRRLVAAVKEVGACLVVIDSLGEAFGLDGINENNDNEVAPWLRSVGRGLADTGACVVIIDHVTKSVDNPLYAKGSARKRAQIGGTSFLVEALQPLTKGKGGKLRLTCAKDRYGTFTRGQVAAEVVFSPSGPDDMLVRIFPPAGVDVTSPQEKQDNDVIDCAVAMVKVCAKKRGSFTKTLIVKSTAGWRNDVKGLAFEHLVETSRVVDAGSGKWKLP